MFFSRLSRRNTNWLGTFMDSCNTWPPVRPRTPRPSSTTSPDQPITAWLSRHENGVRFRPCSGQVLTSFSLNRPQLPYGNFPLSGFANRDYTHRLSIEI